MTISTTKEQYAKYMAELQEQLDKENLPYPAELCAWLQEVLRIKKMWKQDAEPGSPEA